MTKDKREKLLARIEESVKSFRKAEENEGCGSCECRWCAIGDEGCFRGFAYGAWALLVDIRDALKGEGK